MHNIALVVFAVSAMAFITVLNVVVCRLWIRVDRVERRLKEIDVDKLNKTIESLAWENGELVQARNRAISTGEYYTEECFEKRRASK